MKSYNTRIKSVFIAAIMLIMLLPLNAGVYTGDFIFIGTGVKSLSMGGAYSAVADDPSAVYWNPAGIAQIRKIKLDFNHSFLYNNMASYDVVTYCQPLPNSVTIGLNWTRLTIPDIKHFSESHLTGLSSDKRAANIDLQLTGIADSYFDNTDDIFYFNFAKNIHRDINFGWFFFKLPVDFNFGVNVKYIKRTIDDKSGTGVGFDFGFLTRTDLATLLDVPWMGDFSFGYVMKDIGGTTISWDTESKHEDEIDYNRRVAFAVAQPIPKYNSVLTLSADIHHEEDKILQLGTQVQFRNNYFLRGGYYDENFSGGLGLKIKNVTIDYAIISNVLGPTNRLGFSLEF